MRLLLLLLLLALAVVGRGDGHDAIGRARRGLTWSHWSKHDNVPPHTNTLRDDDDEKYKEGIKFQLYTRENGEEPELIDIYQKPNLKYFNPKRPTKVCTHGWMTDGAGLTQLRTAFLSTMDVNFIAVNWTQIDTMFYPWARDGVPLVGRRLAYLLDFMRMALGVRLESVHLVGHSLGAHISGVAGKLVQWGRVGRITGLDPAGPLIPDDPKQRLSATDAIFVDVIHTCANVLGYKEAIGDVDFFPNGGVCIQPGCTLRDMTKGTCSHNRGYDFFEESIYKRNSFIAVPCIASTKTPDVSDMKRAVIMGLDTPLTANGSYCLSTSDQSPFGMDPSQYKAVVPEVPHLHLMGAAGGDDFSTEQDNEVDLEVQRDMTILRAFMKRGLDERQRARHRG